MNHKRLLQMETLEDRQLLTAVPYETQDFSASSDDSPACVQTEIPAISENSSADFIVQMGEQENAVVYNAHDFNVIHSFLEQKTGTKKNGVILNSNYDSEDPTTWTGVRWTEVNGEQRVSMISWNCYDSNLKGNLNLSGCTSLTMLFCYNNQLSSLNVSGCTALTDIDCSENKLTSLNASGCSSLDLLSCYDNSLTSLNLSNCTALTSVSCYNNYLKELTIVSVNELEIDCSSNSLESLDVTACLKLQTLNCNENKLTSLNLANNSLLSELSCASNKGLAELNLSQNFNLETLECNTCAFKELDLTSCKKLEELTCWNTGLSTVITPAELIHRLTVYLVGTTGTWTFKSASCEEKTNDGYTLEELPTVATNGSKTVTFETVPIPDGYDEEDFMKIYEFLIQSDSSGVSNGKKINPNFKVSDVNTWAGITWTDTEVTVEQQTTTVKVATGINWTEVALCGSADFSGMALTTLVISASESNPGKLESLNLEGCTELKTLACDYNSLTELILVGCGNLESLSCISAQMKELDLSARQLKEVNLTNCTALESLLCSGNELETLDVSSCAALSYLDCKENLLTELNLSTCTNLAILYCENNRFTELNILENQALWTLSCGNPELSNVWVSTVVRNKLTITLWNEAGIAWTLTDFFGNEIPLELESTNSFIISSFPCTASSNGQSILFKDPTTPPDGFCATEYLALQEFLETETTEELKNGQLLNDSYDKDQPSTWTGVTWTLASNNERKVCKLCIQVPGLTGTLAKETFTACTFFAFEKTEPETTPEINACISVTDSDFTSQKMPDDSTYINEWNVLGVELWSDFLTSTGKTVEITWNADQFDLVETAWEENASLTIHRDGVTITLLESEAGRAVVKLSSGKGFTANEGNTLLGILKFKPKENIEAGYSKGTEIHVGNQTHNTQIWSVVYDLDDSGEIGIKDLVIFAKVYGTDDWKADFDCSGKVQIEDLVIFAKNYGKKSTDVNQRIEYSPNYTPREYEQEISEPEALRTQVTDCVWQNFFGDEEEEEGEEELTRVKKIAYSI